MFVGDKEQVGVGVLHRHNEFLTLTYVSSEGLRVLHFIVVFLAMVALDTPGPQTFAHIPLYIAHNNTADH